MRSVFMDFVLVLAKITPKNGCKDSIIEIAQDLIEETLKEEGNIDYQLLNSTNDNSLTFVERWASPDALKQHMATPHFQTFGSDSQEFVENMDIEIIGAEKLVL